MGDIISNNMGNVVSKSNNVTINATNNKSEEKPPIKMEWLKGLISQNKLAECLTELESIFTEAKNKDALNEVVLFTSRLQLLEKQERLGLIGKGQISKEHIKIKAGLLDLIDKELTP
jgi:hypothetical protein